jgi:hypothetical protein
MIKTPVFVDTDGLIKDADGMLICEPNPDATYMLDNAIVDAINENAELKTRLAMYEEALAAIKADYRLKGVECSYCGDAAQIATRALQEVNNDTPS